MAELSITISPIYMPCWPFASPPLANRRLNLGMIKEYHNTFVGGPLFMLNQNTTNQTIISLNATYVFLKNNKGVTTAL